MKSNKAKRHINRGLNEVLAAMGHDQILIVSDYAELQRLFPESGHEIVPHVDLMGNIANQAIAVIRTGAYNPWGNIALVLGTARYAWFTHSEITIT
ncbi:D-ribose pyranase [compost metagenome]